MTDNTGRSFDAGGRCAARQLVISVVGTALLHLEADTGMTQEEKDGNAARVRLLRAATTLLDLKVDRSRIAGLVDECRQALQVIATEAP